jgi:hypothetical protein
MTLKDLFLKIREAPHIQLEAQAASYFVEREGNTLRILFEESNGRTDWRNNFRFLAVPTKPYKGMTSVWFVHRGFFGVWEVIEPQLAELIADPTVERIEIGGYSHGGAIALLCFEYCRYHRPEIKVEGFGFGAPRVLWGPVPKDVQERLADFRVIRNGDDLVTHLPPLFLGYRQVGKLEEIGAPVGPIKDHYPNAYLSALDGIEKE